jgi:hypothetical protein
MFAKLCKPFFYKSLMPGFFYQTPSHIIQHFSMLQFARFSHITYVRLFCREIPLKYKCVQFQAHSGRLIRFMPVHSLALISHLLYDLLTQNKIQNPGQAIHLLMHQYSDFRTGTFS